MPARLCTVPNSFIKVLEIVRASREPLHLHIDHPQNPTKMALNLTVLLVEYARRREMIFNRLVHIRRLGIDRAQ